MFTINAIKRLISHPDPKIDITWRDFAIEFLWLKRCGLISISWGVWALHLGVRPSHWKWGHEVEQFDFVADYWGLGPIVLLCRMN